MHVQCNTLVNALQFSCYTYMYMYMYINLLALHIRNLYFWVALRICWKLKCGTSFQVHGQPSADSLESLLFPWWIFLDAKETGKALKLFIKKN